VAFCPCGLARVNGARNLDGGRSSLARSERRVSSCPGSRRLHAVGPLLFKHVAQRWRFQENFEGVRMGGTGRRFDTDRGAFSWYRRAGWNHFSFRRFASGSGHESRWSAWVRADPYLLSWHDDGCGCGLRTILPCPSGARINQSFDGQCHRGQWPAPGSRHRQADR
jgi:hypothetical protein